MYSLNYTNTREKGYAITLLYNKKSINFRT